MYAYQDIVRDDILRMIPSDGKIIASIGCGYAATEEQLVRAGREVHGVDISATAIDVARHRLTSARVICPDGELPFKPESLDGLILADVIEHIPQAWEALRRFAELVRPGGWVVISVPNMRNLWEMTRYVWHGDWPEDDSGIFDRTHLQFMTHRRLDRWIRSAGLRVERRFARPDPRHPRIMPVIGVVNASLLGALDHLLDYQIQVRCRKPEVSGNGVAGV